MPNEIFLTDEIYQFLRCSSTTLWRVRQTPDFPQPRQSRQAPALAAQANRTVTRRWRL